LTIETAEQISTYASVMWEPDDLIEIRPLKPWGATRFWCKSSELHYHIENMQEENQRGHNMYAGACPRSRDGGGSADDVDGGRVLWADFDHCDPNEAIRVAGEVGLPIASMVVSTGHGAHLFWRIDAWLPKEEHKSAMNALTDFMLSREETAKYTDKSVKDPARILRLPGFTNHKPPVAVSSIVFADPASRHSLSAFPAAEAQKIIHGIPASGGDENTDRARRYLAAMPGSGEGGRNAATFKAACVLLNDYSLSDDVAWQMLSGWDQAANSPPLGGDELTRIVANAKKHAKKPAGCKIRVDQDDSDVDLSGILGRAMTMESIPDRFLNVPGLIGAVMAHNLDTAPKPQPVLALSGAIALQAILCARKVKDSNGTRPNLYLCGVANSGAGKDHARQMNKRILFEAGLSHLQAEGIKSGSGLVNSLVTQPAILFQVDEYGRFVKSASNQQSNPHVYEIISKLLSLYTTSGSVFESDRYADAEKGGKQVQNPHAIVYGTTVPRSLYEGLTEESITDGFLSRTLIFDVGNSNPKRRRVRESAIPQPIIDRAKWWGDYSPPGSGNMNPEAAEVGFTDEAEIIGADFIDAEHEAQNALGHNPAAILWTRTAQNADKLALLYAVSREPESPIIDRAAAEWGYGLAEWLTRRMVTLMADNVSDNPFHSACLRLLRKLRDGGGRLNHSVLLKRMKVDSASFMRIVDTLVQREEIAVFASENGGKGGTDYAIA
jgi:hypothetical protein